MGEKDLVFDRKKHILCSKHAAKALRDRLLYGCGGMPLLKGF